MKIRRARVVPLFLLVGLGLSAMPRTACSAEMPLPLWVEHLRCEYRVNPVGVDLARPRLSWALNSDRRNVRQLAYQILVASSAEKLDRGEGDLWDSGRVASDQQLHVEYAGKPLTSRARCHWKVRVWPALLSRSADSTSAGAVDEGGDQSGVPSDWSEPAAWTMGLMERSDWQAKWIADPAAATQVTGGGPHNGYHSEIAKSADTAKWVAVDFGQPRAFDSVRLFPARPYDWQPDTPGFLFPVRFRLEAASRADFSDVRTLLDRTDADQPNPGTNAPVYRLPPSSAQFVRLTVTRLGRRDGDNFAFALAEMQVMKGEEPLAQGAQVLALDTIETGAWGKKT